VRILYEARTWDISGDTGAVLAELGWVETLVIVTESIFSLLLH